MKRVLTGDRTLRAGRWLAVSVLLCVAPACSQQPGFKSQGAQGLPCYTEEPVSNLDVTLDGHDAVVIDRGERVALRFAPSIWPRMEDRYEGNGYVLTIDPEAVLQRPDGSQRGPCH